MAHDPLVDPAYRIKQSPVLAHRERLRVIDQTPAPGESVPWRLHPDADDSIKRLRGVLEVREKDTERVITLRPLERQIVPQQRPQTTVNATGEDCRFLIVRGPGREEFRAPPKRDDGQI